MIELAATPFEILRYINRMEEDGDVVVFGKVKYYNDEAVKYCRIDIRKDIDADLENTDSNSGCIYIRNSEGDRVEIKAEYMNEDDFDNSESDFKNDFNNATEIDGEFIYCEHCDLLPEEWSIAAAIAQTVL